MSSAAYAARLKGALRNARRAQRARATDSITGDSSEPMAAPRLPAIPAPAKALIERRLVSPTPKPVRPEPFPLELPGYAGWCLRCHVPVAKYRPLCVACGGLHRQILWELERGKISAEEAAERWHLA